MPKFIDNFLLYLLKLIDILCFRHRNLLPKKVDRWKHRNEV